MSDLKNYLALALLPDIGMVLGRRLMSVFGSPEKIFCASHNDLKKVENIGENRAKSITEFNWERVDQEIKKAEENNITLLCIEDDAYPASIKLFHDAPFVLYVKGEIKEEDKYAVGVVGSRNATSYGRLVAEKMSFSLAKFGLTIVSGMAMGVDSAAHNGALKASGRTIAVMGSGLDVPYPHSNKKLMDSIASSGAVVSEFPFGTPPLRENFPRRNRIISALSLGLLVVEAAVDSGSLITVRYALEQGRDVFAVPGNITSGNSRGTNALIKNGARLVEDAEDIISELRPQIKGILSEDRILTQKVLPQLSEVEKMLFGCLTTEPKQVDLIIRESRIATPKALSVLLNLELKGIAKQMEGNMYSLN
ncbi:MAG: DNA-processing protein DprA [Thermodesulfovibrionia bacterium]|nr:DNA-processing protein DprA [Thermodesulfovibrionia bacterium]